MKCKVTPQLQHLIHPIETFKFDPNNVRTHDDRNLTAIENSLETFGQVKPIVYHPDNDIIIAGNGTVAAAIRLGWTHIAATPMINTQWSREYAIADNRTAELAEWDYHQLMRNLGELSEELIEQIGFNEEEIQALKNNMEKQEEKKEKVEKPKTSVRVLKIKKQDVEVLMEALTVALQESGYPYQPKSY